MICLSTRFYFRTHLRDQGRAVPQGGEDTIRLARD